MEKIDAPEELSPVPAGKNLLPGISPEDFDTVWTQTIADWVGAEAERTVADGSVTYDIKNVGEEDWNVQLKQSGIRLEAGETYVVTFKVKTTAARTIKAGVMSTSYNLYGGVDIVLAADKEQDVTFEFTMKENDGAADFYISMGQIKDDETGELIDTPASVITLSDISLIKKATFKVKVK